MKLVAGGDGQHGVFLVSGSGRIASWSQACEQLLGYEPGAVLRRPLDSLVAGEARARFLSIAELDHTVATGLSTTLVKADGVPAAFTMTLTPQTGAGGRFAGFAVTIDRADGARSEPRSNFERIAGMPLGAVVDLLPGTFYVIDSKARFVMWNKRVEQATQLTAAELAAMPAFNMFIEHERTLVAEKISEVFVREGEVVVEASLLSKDGKATPFLFTGTRFTVGGEAFLCGMGLDLTERHKQEEQLRLRERALHASSNGIFIVRCVRDAHVIEYINPAFERITGLRPDEVLGQDSLDMAGFLAMPGLDEPERAQIRTALRQGREARATFRSLRKSGELFWNDMTVAPVNDPGGRASHFIGVINDVTEARQRTSRLEHEINHDVLTGLANRNLMWDRLEHAIHAAQREKSLVAVVLVDLDKFKEINDTLGHEAGDEVLRVVARKMQASVRDSDTVARLGGDEFVLILSNQPSVRFTLRMIERLRHDIGTAVTIGDQELVVQSSMGVSVFPHDGKTVGALIQSADVAMYHAKAAGRNDVHFYSNEMSATSDAKQKLREGIRQAIANDELFLVFQPKLSAQSGRIVGAEALLRWRHPKHGVLLPAAFIAEAEESGLILCLGDWVSDQVCGTIARLADMGFPEQVISMNASFQEFSQPGYVRRLADRLSGAGVAPASFELEINESNLLKDVELSQRVFGEMAQLGIRVAVDDFGAGTINLKNLQQVPLACLKIARACVGALEHDHLSAMVAKTIIGMGHLMNLTVLGEGVETSDQDSFLKSSGCDLIQGNFFCAPVPYEDFERLLRQDVPAPALH